jgi:exopolysaccharide biosynthesis predicted pyruvyltransferase EpsI
MLGIPNILYPERYGKNRAFFETWTRGISDVYWENSLDEAVARAVSLAEVH